MTQYARDELIKLGYNSQHIHTSLSSRQIGTVLLENIKHREKRAVVVFKGSQNTIFTEEAIKSLLKNNQDANPLLCRQDA
jgi:catabolite regulation protein CreA